MSKELARKAYQKINEELAVVSAGEMKNEHYLSLLEELDTVNFVKHIVRDVCFNIIEYKTPLTQAALIEHVGFIAFNHKFAANEYEGAIVTACIEIIYNYAQEMHNYQAIYVADEESDEHEEGC